MLFNEDIRILYKTKPRRKKIKVKAHYARLAALAGLDKSEIKTSEFMKLLINN
jgi:hypothetical protein